MASSRNMHDRLKWLALIAAASLPAAAQAQDCTAPVTQMAMQNCAYDEFLAAQADYASAYKALATALASRPRARLLKMQQAWMRYRGAACEFESCAVEGGSAPPLANYQCLTRMTRARTAELAKMAECPEGDISCVARKPAR